MSKRLPRFIIEGVWSGYTSNQSRVVHRKVHIGAYKNLRAWAERVRSILFTDGTSLYITVRSCKPRERIKQIRGYDDLIDGCETYDVDSVAALYEARKALRGASKQQIQELQEEFLDGDGNRG